MPTFVLNDETQVNSYGFSIPNDGIDLSQFEENPVMLNSHYNSTESVIGRWEKVRKKGSQLLADSVFDSDDKEAKKIEGKVDRGFLKAVSMGLGFYLEDLVYLAGKMILKKCVLKEVSIVAVPSNAKALRLYDLSTGELFDDKQLQLQLSGLQQNNLNTENKTSMKEILLSASALVALGLSAQPTDAAGLDAAITKLKGDYEAEKAGRLSDKTAWEIKVTDAETKLSDALTAQSKGVLDAAIAEGKIVEEDRATFAALPADVMLATLAKIPAKVSLSGLVKSISTPGAVAEPTTFEELMKLSDDQKSAFKIANPTKYAALLA